VKLQYILPLVVAACTKLNGALFGLYELKYLFNSLVLKPPFLALPLQNEIECAIELVSNCKQYYTLIVKFEVFVENG
jgi:hypothetical protein